MVDTCRSQRGARQLGGPRHGRAGRSRDAIGDAQRAHPPSDGCATDQFAEFGLNPQRTASTDAATGITAANVRQLHRLQVHLPGTVDSSAIFLANATVGGTPQNVVIVTTTYGITLAISPASGQILWRFTPQGIGSWAGGPQITVASPIADPSGLYVYATSPTAWCTS